MSTYNQYKSSTTRNACTIVSLLHIMLYKYAIRVSPNFLIKLAIFFDKLGTFFISSGATFSVIDNSFINEMNKKLDLNFKLVTKSITGLKESDQGIYQLRVKGYSTKKFNTIKADGKITLAEMDYLKTFTGGVPHATTYGKGYFIDTDGSKNIEMSLEVLKYGVKLGLFGNTIRTIETNDKETSEVTKLTIEMFKHEKKGHLNLFYNKYSESAYLKKAREIYFYGR